MTNFLLSPLHAAGALMLALSCAVAGTAAPLTAVDARGHQIVLTQPPQRVITLAPHLAELVAAVGAGEQLIAVSRFTDYPPSLLRLPQVGDAAALDFERIAALQPDLILAWDSGNRADSIARLERLDLSVYVLAQPRLADISAQLRALGALLGRAQQGARAAETFESEIAALRARYGTRMPVSVYAEIWHEPSITVSAAHWIDEVLSLCGGRNIFAQARGLTPAVALESIYQHDPQVILGGGFGGADAFVKAWQPHRVLRAVRQNQVHYVDPDELQRPTLRLLRGARVACAVLDGAR